MKNLVKWIGKWFFKDRKPLQLEDLPFNNHRPGAVIKCPQCGKQHELTMGRLGESIEYKDGERIVHKVDKAYPALLAYKCRGNLYLAAFKPELADKDFGE